MTKIKEIEMDYKYYQEFKRKIDIIKAEQLFFF